jgi:hypothetical protein
MPIEVTLPPSQHVIRVHDDREALFLQDPACPALGRIIEAGNAAARQAAVSAAAAEKSRAAVAAAASALSLLPDPALGDDPFDVSAPFARIVAEQIASARLWNPESAAILAEREATISCPLPALSAPGAAAAIAGLVAPTVAQVLAL